jgi:hypothetical protein
MKFNRGISLHSSKPPSKHTNSESNLNRWRRTLVYLLICRVQSLRASRWGGRGREPTRGRERLGRAVMRRQRVVPALSLRQWRRQGGQWAPTASLMSTFTSLPLIREKIEQIERWGDRSRAINGAVMPLRRGGHRPAVRADGPSLLKVNNGPQIPQSFTAQMILNLIPSVTWG